MIKDLNIQLGSDGFIVADAYQMNMLSSPTLKTLPFTPIPEISSVPTIVTIVEVSRSQTCVVDVNLGIESRTGRRCCTQIICSMLSAEGAYKDLQALPCHFGWLKSSPFHRHGIRPHSQGRWEIDLHRLAFKSNSESSTTVPENFKHQDLDR
ncbi:hypothetical protein P8452_08316 [Trifolium repens]|nr:hypothetical protein P8452_08316 [Trifolium repens]